jgi:hypothetical protein
VYENRVLRKMFRPERDEVALWCRKLHYEDLCDLYSSSIIVKIIKSRRMRWAGHVARMWKKWTAYLLFIAMSEGKRPRRRSIDNVKMDLVDMGWSGWSRWSGSGYRQVIAVINLGVP